MRLMHLAVAVVCFAAAIQGAQARSSEFTGVPKIVDGDTIRFGDVRLHLEGIDAPRPTKPVSTKPERAGSAAWRPATSSSRWPGPNHGNAE